MRAGLIGLVGLVLMATLLLLGGASGAAAQEATATPTPAATSTPVFIFGMPIILPTGIGDWVPPYLTAVPVGTPRSTNFQETGGGLIIAETANMRQALFAVMGPVGKIFDLLLTLLLAVWTVFTLKAIWKGGKQIVVDYKNYGRTDAVSTHTVKHIRDISRRMIPTRSRRSKTTGTGFLSKTRKSKGFLD